MDKTKIKNFAIDARRQLIEEITLKARLIGIRKDGIQEPTNETNQIQFFGEYSISGDDIQRRQKLVAELKKRSTGKKLEEVLPVFIEEIAYTWFNRLIAIRFMEVNRYLPSRIRVLSSETPGQNQPDIITEAFNSDLKFNATETEQIKFALLNQTVDVMNDLYKMIFIKQANKLNDVLPQLFEKIADYSELLFTPNYTDVNGVIHKLVNDIDEADFDVNKSGQVEIIGWLYQYYNEEPKAIAFKKSKYTESDIPAVTQLFTPDWIVKYLVENSLGRFWIDHLRTAGDSRSEKEISETFNWFYYMPATEQSTNITIQIADEDISKSGITIENIKFIDPAMGSGHILVYAYDVFMQIYESLGYSLVDAAKLIVQKNIYGLDIDTRAFQLTYFAIMMKLRKDDRRALTRDIKPNVFDVPESSTIEIDVLATLIDKTESTNKAQLRKDLDNLINAFKYGNEYGSLIDFDKTLNWNDLQLLTNPNLAQGQSTLETINLPLYQKNLADLIKVGMLLFQTYEIGVMNPPYMGSGKMDTILGKYVKTKFPHSKSDLFAVFIERLGSMIAKHGYYAMITQHSWMFLSSFEQLRAMLTKHTLINLAHLGTRAFEEIGGEVVQTVAFVMRKSSLSEYVGTYERLVNFDSQQKKEIGFTESVKNSNVDYLYRTNQANFKKIPGNPIAYWASSKLLKSFNDNILLQNIGDSRNGLQPKVTSRFVRQWYEVEYLNINFKIESITQTNNSTEKWYPYNKGGAKRKWYGNYDYVVNWKFNGSEIRSIKRNGKPYAVIPSQKYYFKPSLTWPKITSGTFSARYRVKGSIPADAGNSTYFKNLFDLKYVLGVVNTKVGDYILKMLNPTLNLQTREFASLPIIEHVNKNAVAETVNENIKITKTDWDSFETSWDFTQHPLLSKIDEHNRNWTVEAVYESWADEAQTRFDQLKANEEELNRIFIDLYGLQDELTPEVEDKDVSVRRADQNRDIKSLLSYFIGLVFGRYSLDVKGLVFAGGEFDKAKYQTFIPNTDDVVMLTDADYFGDERDIMYRFKEFLATTFGEGNLIQNLNFIADVLGGKGKPEEVIRNYFFKDFFKDHVQIYKKRPIYWQLESGKLGGFKALIYLHRYDENTMAMIRTNYLNELQNAYEARLSTLTNLIDNATDTKSKNGYEKQRVKLTNQLDELVMFEDKIAYLASKHVVLDLDDGVVENYKKVQSDEDGNLLNVFSKLK
ncbi:BREX-1 system adenine-specific DNA-methyltransferase PglX [Leuconostoc inhae]|uniref:BREX-1 system adenine-specific DNA-methyltransferase PglX n=1 Tax=Leuconostoc inhae TaxID=178001 RepID=UPI001C7E02B7|nr:BREX-1 system adenine-specific DNA-methyltransferase PglX [Leuconostoc inhae]